MVISFSSRKVERAPRARPSAPRRPDRVARELFSSAQFETRAAPRESPAQHRQHRLRCGHSGQVRRAARAGDDHLDPALLGGRSIFEEQVRRTVRGNDPHIVRHVQLPQRVRGVLHRLPIGRGAHDNPHQRRSRVFPCGSRFFHALNLCPGISPLLQNRTPAARPATSGKKPHSTVFFIAMRLFRAHSTRAAIRPPDTGIR